MPTVSTISTAPARITAAQREERPEGAAPRKSLNLFDATCIIAGIIIGAGIYETAPTVAACMGSRPATLSIWLAGGLLALTGALCYAELGTAFPRQGGDYVYLSRAYGRSVGFLFGWSQLAVVRPGDIALLAFVFARYAKTIFDPLGYGLQLYAVLAIVLLTGVNVLGVRESKWTQNLLTVVKVAGLVVIAVLAFFAPAPAGSGFGFEAHPGGLNLAMILVLFTFGGWNEIAYVAAEVKNPRRNILRSLVIGVAVITVLYLLVNGAFMGALGFSGMATSEAVATDTAARVFPNAASRAISILICLSALGAINGLVLTGSRISYALGTEHALFKGVGRWNARLGTPVRALIVQGLIAVAIVLAAGSFINTILYAAPIVWLFFLATAVSVFVLRRREPSADRPYRVHALMPILFCLCCVFMLYSCLTYAAGQKPAALLVLGGTLLAGGFALLASRAMGGRYKPDPAVPGAPFPPR
jgi:amino acid transporter